jgi:hypothetical protein
LAGKGKSSDAKKALRAASQARGANRKQDRVVAERNQALANREATREGRLTPWQQAKADRAVRRAKEGKGQAWAKRQPDSPEG